MVAPIRHRTRDCVYDIPKCKLTKNPIFTHYFITNDKWVPLVEKGATSKDQQRILIFTSRDQATIFALECDAIDDFLVIGLTKDTWNVFKQTEQYIIVSKEGDK